jgi:hypothetical protein
MDESTTVVRCGACGKTLAEPPGLNPERRQPCPNCGSTARNFAVSITTQAVTITDVIATVTKDVTIQAPAAEATAEAPAPEVIAPRLEELGFQLRWWQLSEGGAWMLRVFNDAGDFIDASIQDSPADALLAVAERLIPPEG